jgi:RNA polymerase sigma-70 factor, ECF subfamily
VPKVVRRADSEAAAMASLYDEHAAVLWRYAIGLTGDAGSAEDVVRETLLRVWQHPVVTAGAERSARASLFAIARDLVIEEVGSAPDRLAIANAMGRLSAEYRAVIERSCFRGWPTAQIATDLGIADETVKSRLHYAARALRRLTLQQTAVAR